MLGISTDSSWSQRTFTTALGNINYPLLADFHPKGEVCESYGIYNEKRGNGHRAIIIIDKKGIVRYKKIWERGIPGTEEVLAELDAVLKKDQ